VSLSTAIALIVIADIALIAGLVYAMAHPRRLTPHLSASETHAERQATATAAIAQTRSGELSPAPGRGRAATDRRHRHAAAGKSRRPALRLASKASSGSRP
jgi:hypothetical protein